VAGVSKTGIAQVMEGEKGVMNKFRYSSPKLAASPVQERTGQDSPTETKSHALADGRRSCSARSTLVSTKTVRWPASLCEHPCESHNQRVAR
jgi:hypothetical protein